MPNLFRQTVPISIGFDKYLDSVFVDISIQNVYNQPKTSNNKVSQNQNLLHEQQKILLALVHGHYFHFRLSLSN